MKGIRFQITSTIGVPPHLETGSGEPMPSIEVRDTDLVFLTIGSMVSNASFGAHDRPVDKPEVGSENLGGAWTLWKKIAAKQPDFGRPEQFLRDISQSKMMTFTVTFRGGLFQRKFEWLVERQMGRQSPLPITASPWILHLHTYRQPLFPDQPRDTCVIWVTALRDDNIGKFVKKTMPECTGREILVELLGHLQFDQNEAEKNEILDTSTCIPCMLPYSISQFLSRTARNWSTVKGRFIASPHPPACDPTKASRVLVRTSSRDRACGRADPRALRDRGVGPELRPVG